MFVSTLLDVLLSSQNPLLFSMHSLTEYKMVQMKEGGMLKTHPQLTVKGVGFDRTLGGLEMDIRLRDHLAKQFEVSVVGVCT